MSDTKALARPRQVSMAGGMALVVALLLVVSLFDAMSQVRSVETRSAIADFLATPPGDGLSLGVDEVVRLLRLVVLLNGAVAAAAVVLSVYVFQRHNGARIGLTVAAALLLFTAPVTDASTGVLPVVLAFAATMLWSRPARDWFAGREPARAAADASQPEQPPTAHQEHSTRLPAWAPPTAEDRLSDEAPQQPGPAPYPFGSRPGAEGRAPAHPPVGYPQPAYPQQPAGGPQQGGYAAWGGAGQRRPASVTAAAWITWVFTGLTVVGYVLLLAVMVVARDTFLEALRGDPQVAQSNLTTDEIVASLWVVGVVVILWSLVAAVLAFLAYRRMGWARVTLAVSAGMTGLLALVLAAFGSPGTLLHAVAAFTTVGLLVSRSANAWYADRGPGAHSSGGPYGGWPTGPTPPGGPGGPAYPPAPPQQPEQPKPPKPPKNVW